jgi:hypothetical protein
MLNVFMQSVIMQSVVMLSVVAPQLSLPYNRCPFAIGQNKLERLPLPSVTPGPNVLNLFAAVYFMNLFNKLECLYMAGLSSLV